MPEIGTELKAVLVELKTSIIKVKFENIINVKGSSNFFSQIENFFAPGLF